LKKISPWLLGSGLITALILLPLIVILFSFTEGFSDVWKHLAETILGEISLNTFWLVLGVGSGTVFLGVSLAALVVFCEFPGRKYFEWLLVLPLAFPAYVLGFVWIGLLDYSAVIPTFLRETFEFNLLNWFQIRSRVGVILAMSFALYPYVYLLARQAFSSQGQSVWEASLVLGYKPLQIFFRVVLPMASPWIFAGFMIVMMDTLADFGTVSVFNYDTFTTAIYKAWFGLFSLSAARQLAAVLQLRGMAVCDTCLHILSRGELRLYVLSLLQRDLFPSGVLRVL